MLSELLPQVLPCRDDAGFCCQESGETTVADTVFTDITTLRHNRPPELLNLPENKIVAVTAGEGTDTYPKVWDRRSPLSPAVKRIFVHPRLLPACAYKKGHEAGKVPEKTGLRTTQDT